MFRRPMLEKMLAWRLVLRVWVFCDSQDFCGVRVWGVVVGEVGVGESCGSGVDSGLSFLLSWTVSGKAKIVSNAVDVARTRLTLRFTTGVPPFPSIFIRNAPIVGHNVCARYCMEVVRKNNVARSVVDGMTSVYEANSIANPISKFPPISPGRPDKYNVQIGTFGNPIYRSSHTVHTQVTFTLCKMRTTFRPYRSASHPSGMAPIIADNMRKNMINPADFARFFWMLSSLHSRSGICLPNSARGELRAR